MEFVYITTSLCIKFIVNYYIKMKMSILLALFLFGFVFDLTRAIQLGNCAPSSTIYSKLACENEKMVISCPKNTTIKMETAQYGRTRTDICVGQSQNNSCIDISSHCILEHVCSGKNECIISANNDLFGDPCPNTYKYLEAKYCCEPPYPAGCDTVPQVETSCSTKVLSLTCQVGTVNVLSANYGRTDSTTCPYGPIKTTNCRADNTTKIVSERCNGKGSCDVLADHRVFGDPCYGTFKYLTAKFCCKMG